MEQIRSVEKDLDRKEIRWIRGFQPASFFPFLFLFRFPLHRGTVIQIGLEQIAEKIALNLNSIELNLQINLRRIFARTVFLAKISQNPAVDG